MKKSFFSKYGALIAAAVLFLALGFIYCAPSLKGMQIQAGDNVNGLSAVQEGVQYHKATGDYSFWTGSMFSGMPNYQIGGGQYKSELLIKPFRKFLQRGTSHPAWIIIFYLFSFYFLMRAFDIDKWLSIAGAVAIAFSSYFIVIIAAGHGGKTVSISYISLVMAGLVLIFRKKYGLGFIMTMFFTCIGFTIHPQMSYYLFMMIGLLWIAEVCIHISEKRWKDLLVGTLLFFAGVGIGLGTRSANVFANQEYARETMRGGHSDLDKADAPKKSSSGLSLDYVTEYSYGFAESLSFMVPGVMGGSSSAPVSTDSQLYKSLVKNGVDKRTAASFCQNVPMYWGDQSFTAGNVYMGAVICFLFVLGLILVRGAYKWAIAAATLFSIMLAWGFHFMPLTEFFYNYFPMYNKFRAVSSILIVAEIAMPLLGFLAVKEIMEGETKRKQIFNGIYISAGITAGICLILALFGGSMFTFVSPTDGSYAAQLPDFVYQGILDERKALLVSDSWRSLLFILLAAALMWLTEQGLLKKWMTVSALTVLILVDMWPVDKRYFNDNSFVSAKQSKAVFDMYPYEKQILADKDPDFRVMNLTSNTFTDARTSYYLKSVGGYSAAKLRRYQDLIDRHISQMNMNVLNMLNTKYFITKGDDGNPTPLRNPGAMGNAWFVDELVTVGTANEEIDAIGNMDLHKTAVLDQSFSKYVTNPNPGHDASASVKLTSYTPKALDYETSSAKDGTVVFSEIYYPYGWKASIDGTPAEHFRVNYVLRAMNVPAGQHKIHFEFDPESVRKGNAVATVCVILMYALTALIAVMALLRRKKA